MHGAGLGGRHNLGGKFREQAVAVARVQSYTITHKHTCQGTALSCFIPFPCTQVAAELRSKVVEATRGLTCSVGIAPNMMLAKVASDKNKPNGQCVVGASRDEVLAFIADLPIRKVGQGG